jgi:hypothetical protein
MPNQFNQFQQYNYQVEKSPDVTLTNYKSPYAQNNMVIRQPLRVAHNVLNNPQPAVYNGDNRFMKNNKFNST